MVMRVHRDRHRLRTRLLAAFRSLDCTTSESRCLSRWPRTLARGGALGRTAQRIAWCSVVVFKLKRSIIIDGDELLSAAAVVGDPDRRVFCHQEIATLVAAKLGAQHLRNGFL